MWQGCCPAAHEDLCPASDCLSQREPAGEAAAPALSCLPSRGSPCLSCCHIPDSETTDNKCSGVETVHWNSLFCGDGQQTDLLSGWPQAWVNPGSFKDTRVNLPPARGPALLCGSFFLQWVSSHGRRRPTALGSLSPTFLTPWPTLLSITSTIMAPGRRRAETGRAGAQTK